MNNKDIRRAAAAAGIKLWEVAASIGIADSTFCRQLRQELPPERRNEILAIIARLERERRNEKIALSVAEAAKLLGISVPTAYELTRRSDFPSFKIGRRTLINRRLLLEWIDGQCAETGCIQSARRR